MAKVFIEETSLTAIGDAIRNKTGDSELMSPAAMVTAINGITISGIDIPNPTFTTNRGVGAFNLNAFNWLIEECGDRITTQNLSSVAQMFKYSTELEKIPFDFNCGNGECCFHNMFEECNSLKEIAGKISPFMPWGMDRMFYRCYNLRYLPTIENIKMSTTHDGAAAYSAGEAFRECHSLRSFSEEFIKEFYGSYVEPYRMFYCCYALDEIKHLRILNCMNSERWGQVFDHCSRLKDIIFAVQEDGTPYILKNHSKTLDLSVYVGYAATVDNILNWNSGITEDKQVHDSTTYETLKNDPDWFTIDPAYSRYNHDSAVNTINSLPDASDYIAQWETATNHTIKFLGESGSATDGGAINTLTEEEIAVAVAKGWTVTFV